jgi:hypothetical protein
MRVLGAWIQQQPPIRLQLYANRFCFSKEFHAVVAAFAAYAAVLETAKRRTKIAQQPAVDPNRSALQLRCDTMGTLNVTGTDDR